MKKLEDIFHGQEIDEQYGEYKELQSLNIEDIWYRNSLIMINGSLTL